MSTAAVSATSDKLTEENVINLIAQALDAPRKNFTLDTKARDIPEWDSIGILGILATLDRERIPCDIADAAALQSVEGVIQVVRSAGRLQST